MAMARQIFRETDRGRRCCQNFLSRDRAHLHEESRRRRDQGSWTPNAAFMWPPRSWTTPSRHAMSAGVARIFGVCCGRRVALLPATEAPGNCVRCMFFSDPLRRTVLVEMKAGLKMDISRCRIDLLRPHLCGLDDRFGARRSATSGSARYEARRGDLHLVAGRHGPVVMV